MVTYKWLGRRFNVPYDTSKRILFEFLTRHPQASHTPSQQQRVFPRRRPGLWHWHCLLTLLPGPPLVSPALQKIKATFLLSGWASEAGEAARHVVRVVEGQQVHWGKWGRGPGVPA